MSNYPVGTAWRLSGAVAEAVVGSGVKGADSFLARVNVNTASTSASLTIYQGPFTGAPSTTGTKIATIDCSSNTRTLEYDVRCPGGIYAVLTPAATGADITVVTI